MQAEDSTIHGVLPAWATDREIQVALEAVATGLLILHGDVVEHSAAKPNPSLVSAAEVHAESPSPREREVLNLLAAGLGNKEIASQLKISDHTVKFHVTSIFNKLRVSSRAEAVAMGIRRGLIAL
jgi:two-component system, NarL family, response regulator YdfI